MYPPQEGGKEGVLPLRLSRWAEKDLHARSKVLLMILQDCVAEAHQDQVIIHVVPGVPEGNILE